MQDSIFLKLVGDPKFDPSIILEEALVEFIKRHPAKVARDRVALKHLIRDPSIIDSISLVVDVNDVESFSTLIDTIERSQNYNRGTIRSRMIQRLGDIREENVEALLKVVKEKLADTRLGQFPEEFFAALTPDQTQDMVLNAIKKDSTTNWLAQDWKIAIATPVGIDAFLVALKKKQVIYNPEIMQLISCAAILVKGDPAAEDILLGVEHHFRGYVCFACGKGLTDNDLIESPSGYTLHRKKCPAEETWPSPYEIIRGKPKALSFECEGCGEIFTTKSGRTLHRKVCPGVR